MDTVVELKQEESWQAWNYSSPRRMGRKGGKYQVSHMTPVALPQDRAGAGPNKSSSSQFLELG